LEHFMKLIRRIHARFLVCRRIACLVAQPVTAGTKGLMELLRARAQGGQLQPRLYFESFEP